MTNPNVAPGATAGARAWLEWFQYKTSPLQLDKMVDKVALQTEAALKEATPKRWFGQVRNGWAVQKPEMGVRVLANGATASNGAPIMLFLEEGTANDGQGFIYPKVKKFLYVPLTKRAAGGWRQGLRWGVDFILKLRVRGQKGQHIVAKERPRAMERLKQGYKELTEEILRKEGFLG